ncbi:MAG: hypothetical protein H6581_19770 [Bacteroidia bacterium]|nr:hypothetical protein [Bacteroidia bacterium]
MIAKSKKAEILSLLDKIEEEHHWKELEELLLEMIDRETKTEYVPSPEELEAIEEGKKDIKEGRFMSLDDFNVEIREWLAK